MAQKYGKKKQPFFLLIKFYKEAYDCINNKTISIRLGTYRSNVSAAFFFLDYASFSTSKLTNQHPKDKPEDVVSLRSFWSD